MMNTTETKAYIELQHLCNEQARQVSDLVRQNAELAQANGKLVDLVRHLADPFHVEMVRITGQTESIDLSGMLAEIQPQPARPVVASGPAADQPADEPPAVDLPSADQPIETPAADAVPEPAESAAAIPTRVCPRCQRTLPGSAFAKWHRTCHECEEAYKEKKPTRAPKATSPRRAKHGLADVLVGVERGTCPGCHREGQGLLPTDGGEKLCYGCRQKQLRNTARLCVVCGGLIPATSSPLATICSPKCRKELSRRQNHERYERRQQASDCTHAKVS